MLVYSHPVLQSLLILLLLYCFRLGLGRFASQHLGMKTAFQWKRHVLLGKVATIGLIAGAFGGFLLTHILWGDSVHFGHHAEVGISLSLVLAASLATGLLMDRNKKQRTTLPLLHALLGAVAVLLSFYQVWSGLSLLTM